MPRQEYLNHLRDEIIKRFSEEELQTLIYEVVDLKDYTDLPGNARPIKIQELISWFIRRGQLGDLINLCQKHRPNGNWTDKNIFISCLTQASVDSRLATFLHQYLIAQGHQVYIDTVKESDDWSEKIDVQIQRASLLVVLLSHQSVASEMLQLTLKKAFQLFQEEKQPHIFPILINYNSPLPHVIHAYLDPSRYAIWENRSDNQKIADEINKAVVRGELSEKTPIKFQKQNEMLAQENRKSPLVSEDGHNLVDESDETPHRPQPSFDPHLLEQLRPPGGTVRIRSKFYIERDADKQVERQVLFPGSITTIRASRQTGKSSLLIRGLEYARSNEANTVFLNLEHVEPRHLSTPEKFYPYLAKNIADQLGIPPQSVEDAWRVELGLSGNMIRFMEHYVLPQINRSLTLGLDEVDRLLDTDTQESFFSLLRAWYNKAAYDRLWEKLNVVMVISTEPVLLIQDVNRSPFNVGLVLYLKDFNEEEIRELNKRHGSPVPQNHFEDLKDLLGGHPFLTRKALYALVVENMTWLQFKQEAPRNTGPFGDHLRRLWWYLQDNENLQTALKQIITTEHCSDNLISYRLLRAGLIKGSGNSYSCRCDLYRMYLQDKL